MPFMRNLGLANREGDLWLTRFVVSLRGCIRVLFVPPRLSFFVGSTWIAIDFKSIKVGCQVRYSIHHRAASSVYSRRVDPFLDSEAGGERYNLPWFDDDFSAGLEIASSALLLGSD
jgi:hypothetical protein